MGRPPTGHDHDVNSPIIICAGMHICLSQSKTIIRQVRSRSRRDRIAKVIAPVRFLSHRDKIQVPDSNLRLDAYLFHIVFTLQIICDFLKTTSAAALFLSRRDSGQSGRKTIKKIKNNRKSTGQSGFPVPFTTYALTVRFLASNVQMLYLHCLLGRTPAPPFHLSDHQNWFFIRQ